MPGTLCGTLVTQDPTMNDYLRAHFAGFIDPYWGTMHVINKNRKIEYIEKESRGKPITLEVRVLGNQSLTVFHRQEVSKAIIDRVAAPPDVVYGLMREGEMMVSNYNLQTGPTPTLAKYFKGWEN